MVRHKIILNPQSAKGATRKKIPEIKRALSELGLVYTLSLTERPWHAAELAREAVVDGYDVVVAVGGDGTVNEVVNGILQSQEDKLGDTLLGVLPVGRGNDFCFASGIPLDFKTACQTLARAQVRTLDAGRISGEQNAHIRYFGNGVGIGFDAVVSRLANRARLTGFLSYLVAALQTMYIYYKAPEMQIGLSNETIRQRSLMVSVMNGRRAGGGFLMAPHGNSSDGLLDLCIAKNVSKAGILSLIPRFMNGTQGGHPAITFKQDTRVTVRAMDGSLPVHVDGEVINKDIQELTIEVLTRRLKVITNGNKQS
jgi:YegS/Rv2252/BmrU family lipid kinase